ncbi:FixH family protein [Vibrio mexicanus]|uniref:FixH family protein n=1 Tax=Vibrio mexicanus TaxID=1004326 RepID=UPI00069A4ED2|nr:FixH family protein [Vibrio mexicanus]
MSLVVATTLLTIISSQEIVTADDSGWTSVAYSPVEISINQFHSWEFEFINGDGATQPCAQLTINGGMPSHNHGLPTEPAITPATNKGRYVLEGIKFHMPGTWQLVLNCEDNERNKHDFTITFDI